MSTFLVFYNFLQSYPFCTQTLNDAVSANDTTNIGTKVILPASITASPRWYAQSFQDAMAIGKELLFCFIKFQNPNAPSLPFGRAGGGDMRTMCKKLNSPPGLCNPWNVPES